MLRVRLKDRKVKGGVLEEVLLNVSLSMAKNLETWLIWLESEACSHPTPWLYSPYFFRMSAQRLQTH